MARPAPSDASKESAVSDGIILGPDLLPTRGPLDKKLYRQILLPNGLRCLLIEDVLAYAADGSGPLDDDDYSEEDDEEEEPIQSSNETKGDDSDDDSEASWEDESGLRDAAACILVGAGSAYDPEECQGVAHFLEHLLFMGSKKYPGENDYSEFVSKRGGSENAWTEWEYTTYSLEIPQDSLWPALDRLAQFFIAPLMLQSAIDRELSAIESEFQLNKNSDSCRWQQLLCGTAAPSHPIARFSWGNLRSLKDIPAARGVDPVAELWKFYNRYYYAANMRMVVVGAYSLDLMQERIVRMFADVPAMPREEGPFPLPIDKAGYASWNAEYKSPIANMGSPFLESMPKIFRIIPVKDRHSICITWPLPPLMEYWSSKPADYISHLMGHEGTGSLLSYFRTKSWATSCVVSSGSDGMEDASSHSLLTCSFTLSEEGLKQWRGVVEAIYQYIGMLRLQCQEGWPDWIFEELRDTEALSYKYEDEPSPDDLVEGLIENMAPHYRLPAERILDESLLLDFDSDAVQNFLDNYLKPSKARIDLWSSMFGRPADFDDGTAKEGTEMLIVDLKVEEEGDSFDPVAAGAPQAERLFGPLFWGAAVPPSLLDSWTRMSEPRTPPLPLTLPPRNPFIPSRLALKQLPAEDSHHPLVNCSLKLCIDVGKSKQWFPATVVQYSRTKNAVLVSYEDENEQWHKVDGNGFDREHSAIRPNFEGTLDGKSVKFRVLATGGRDAIRRFGDESDFDVEDGKSFPAIQPALPSHRLPKEISSSSTLKMWWLQDRHYHRPIVELRLQVICSKANSSPLHRVCAELMQALCIDALVETTYLADVCDLSYAIEATDVGFVIVFDGFDDKLLDLFETVMEVFLSFSGTEYCLPDTILEDRYMACLEVLQRKYKNAGLKASALCSNLRLMALRPTIWSANEKASALEGLDILTFATTSSSLFQGYAIEALYHGNVDRSDADAAKELILKMVDSRGRPGLPRKKYPAQSVLRIPSVYAPCRLVVPSKDSAEPNTSVEMYVQVGKDNLRDRVLTDLLVQMMEAPLFDQLRTKDQFGYDVSCDVRWSYGIIGMIFHVVTNVKSANDVVERVERFLKEYRKDLEQMSDSDFMEHLVGLAKQKLDMFNCLREETNTYWDEIRDGRFEWQSWRSEAVCLRTVTKANVIEAFDKWLVPGTRRNMLAVQVIGTGDGDASDDRPDVASERLGEFYENQVQDFRKLCKKQTWGRVNSKLF